MLKDVHVLSVEGLAELPDSNLMNIGTGFLPLKTRAKAFLKSQEGEAGFMKLEAEKEVLQSQVDTQGEQIDLLERRVAELMSTTVAPVTPKKASAKGK
jgi:predicted RecB family endonuclease